MTDEQLLPPACATTRGELAAFLYGELAADDVRTVERHLSGCAECERHLGELRDVRSLLDLCEEPRQLKEAPAPLAPWRVAVVAVAAGVLATLTLAFFGAELRTRNGEVQLALRLPWAGEQVAAEGNSERPLEGAELESMLRRIARDEATELVASEIALRESDLRSLAVREDGQRQLLLDAVVLAQQREHEELVRALDEALYGSALEHQETREALVDLASYVARNDVP